MTATVVEVPLPAQVDDDFRAFAQVRDAVVAHALGSRVLDLAAEELLPVFSDAYRPRRLWLARVDGRAVGRASAVEPVADPTVADVVVEVLPEHRGRGIGTLLADRVRERLRDSGRTLVQVHVEHAEVPGPRVAPAAASGSLPARDPGVRFLRRAGLDLVQVARVSRLEASAADLDALEGGLGDALAPSHRLHAWTTTTPDRWLDDLARLRAAMNDDEPLGDRVATTDAWDAARVALHDAAQAAAGRPVLVVAAEHRASGRVVGFTELSVPGSGTGPSIQEDTLVLREHRGRGLGRLLKVANLRRLVRDVPGATEVITFNNEDNQPVLALNERLGFRVVGHEGTWQGRLPGGPCGIS